MCTIHRRPAAAVRRIMNALALSALLTVVVGAQVIDRVLATVDGRLVTLSDVRATTVLGLTQASGATTDQALERWIERLLVLQEVDRFAPPEPSRAAIDARVAAVLAPLGTAAQARDTLAGLGIDASWVERWVRDDLRIQAYTDQRFAGSLEATADELANYHREHASELSRDRRDLTTEEAHRLAREFVMTARRRTLVADWLEGLRRRATIVRPGASASEAR